MRQTEETVEQEKFNARVMSCMLIIFAIELTALVSLAVAMGNKAAGA